MKQVEGFWLPDHEQHLIPFLQQGPRKFGGPTYQLHKLNACDPWIKNNRHAVDVGAHCGLWSRILVHTFKHVTAFEPISEHYACLLRNVAEEQFSFTPHQIALGEGSGHISLHTSPTSSGDTFVKEGGEHAAIMKDLDLYMLEDVDFLKIDCEGYELYVIRGGEMTIRKYKPCVIVEQKPGKAKQFGLGDHDAVKLLQSWGAVLRKEISGDFILSWD